MINVNQTLDALYVSRRREEMLGSQNFGSSSCRYNAGRRHGPRCGFGLPLKGLHSAHRESCTSCTILIGQKANDLQRAITDVLSGFVAFQSDSFTKVRSYI